MTNATNETPLDGIDAEPYDPKGQPMVDFTVFGEDGRVARKGSCPANLVELQAFNKGEMVLEGDHPDRVGVEPAKVRHTLVRESQYPSIGDQLDVMWRMFEANPQLLSPEGRAMLDRIQAVKNSIPKGVHYQENADEGGPRYIPSE